MPYLSTAYDDGNIIHIKENKSSSLFLSLGYLLIGFIFISPMVYMELDNYSIKIILYILSGISFYISIVNFLSEAYVKINKDNKSITIKTHKDKFTFKKTNLKFKEVKYIKFKRNTSGNNTNDYEIGIKLLCGEYILLEKSHNDVHAENLASLLSKTIGCTINTKA